MPYSVNKPGYWQDAMLNQFMEMMDEINNNTNARAFVETPGPPMHRGDPSAYGPNGIRKPSVELMPQDEMTRLILQSK